MRKKLNVRVSANSEATRIIVVCIQSRRIGLIVDKVEEVIRIEVDKIDKAPGTSPTIDNYISGVARTPKCMVIILDILKVFSIQEQMALDSLS